MTNGAAIKIEKGVPPPAGKRGRAYPFAEMLVGDSFVHPNRTPTACYTLAKQAGQRLAPKKFQGGKDDKGAFRIWRIE